MPTASTAQPMKFGSVVEMDIRTWPTAMVFEAGERMVLTIAGLGMVLAEFEPLRGAFTAENNGTHYCVHLICTGIATDSEV